MHVTILAYGSRGDVQPYISLAQAFGQRGHQVRLAAPAVFEALATSYGCHFHPLPGDPTALMQRASLEAGDSYWRMIR
ncbi:MAG: glycosyltransferase, partial [Candidatus Promineifilaceae bacterium]